MPTGDVRVYTWVYVCASRYLIKFLARLAENSEQNKMTAANLAIVIAPSLLWPSPASDSSDSMLTNSGLACSLLLVV